MPPTAAPLVASVTQPVVGPRLLCSSAGLMTTEHVMIDRFRIVGLLGRGGMSLVYVADDLVSGARVALKVLHPDLARSESIVERFLAERDILSSIDVPWIVRAIDAGVTDTLCWLALELLDGVPLSALVGERATPPAAVAATGARLARGLAALHAAGYVHCDVKADNVLVMYGADTDGWPQVKLIDFGIAGRIGAEPTDHAFISGTPAYMAPERWTGDQRLAPATDAYGLGCLLYELATGAPPFTGTLVELAQAHCHHAPVKPSALGPVPPALEDIILRLLAKDPAERPSDLRALADQLDAVAASGPLEIAPNRSMHRP